MKELEVVLTELEFVLTELEFVLTELEVALAELEFRLTELEGADGLLSSYNRYAICICVVEHPFKPRTTIK